jgi:hypothetical protein
MVGYTTPPDAEQFTITNTGTAALVDVEAEITGDDGQYFEITSALSPDTIAYSGTATVSVRPRLGIPARAVPYEAALEITGDDDISLNALLSFTVSGHTATSSPGGKDFGTATAGYTAPPAAQQFTITNTGTVALTDVKAEITGGDAQYFEITSALSPATITYPSGTATVNVRPKAGIPARAAPYEARLEITGDDGLSLDVRLTFTVISLGPDPSYSATVSPGAKDFGTATAVYAAPPVAQQFTITNTGTVAITGVEVSIVGADAAAFAVSAPLSDTTIAYPSGTATVSVRPAAGLAVRATRYTAMLHIAYDHGAAIDLPLTFSVADVTRKLGIDISSWSFGSAKEGYAKRLPVHRFTATNTGNTELTDVEVKLEGSDADAFRILLVDFVNDAAPSFVSNAATDGAASFDVGALAYYRLAPGRSLTVNASPKEGLAARKTPYTAELIVTSSEGARASSSLSFKVNAASNGDGGNGGDDNGGNGGNGENGDGGNGEDDNGGNGVSGDGGNASPDTGDDGIDAIIMTLLISALIGVVCIREVILSSAKS